MRAIKEEEDLSDKWYVYQHYFLGTKENPEQYSGIGQGGDAWDLSRHSHFVRLSNVLHSGIGFNINMVATRIDTKKEAEDILLDFENSMENPKYVKRYDISRSRVATLVGAKKVKKKSTKKGKKEIKLTNKGVNKEVDKTVRKVKETKKLTNKGVSKQVNKDVNKPVKKVEKTKKLTKRVDEIVKKVKATRTRKGVSVVTPKGKFQSATAASEAIGVSVPTILYRCKNPKLKDWYKEVL